MKIKAVEHFEMAEKLLERAENVSHAEIKQALALQALAELSCARLIFEHPFG